MSANRNALLRYRILDRCLKERSRDYTIYDLLDKVNESFRDLYGPDGEISLHTIRNDLKYLQDRFTYNAPIKRKRDTDNKCYYVYSDPDFEIFSDSIDATDIESIIGLLQKFRGLPSMEWVEETLSRLMTKNGLGSLEQKVISYDQNEQLSGLEFLSFIVDATIHHRCLTIDYHNYKGTSFRKNFHPYYLKQYNSRWYLFGLDEEYGNIFPLALDRMKGVKESEVKFRENASVNFEEYFRDIIGVTRVEGSEVEPVRLRFSPTRFPYVVSKPLHSSQMVVDGSNCEIVISVRPNNELQQQLFSFGPDVEVISPDWLRREFGEKIIEMAKKYTALQAHCKEG